MTNMQKASLYRVSSITYTRSKSRIGRREKPSSSTADRDDDEVDDSNVNSYDVIGMTPEAKFLQTDEVFDFERECFH
jgi:hypothetical protein